MHNHWNSSTLPALTILSLYYSEYEVVLRQEFHNCYDSDNRSKDNFFPIIIDRQPRAFSRYPKHPSALSVHNPWAPRLAMEIGMQRHLWWRAWFLVVFTNKDHSRSRRWFATCVGFAMCVGFVIGCRGTRYSPPLHLVFRAQNKTGPVNVEWDILDPVLDLHRSEIISSCDIPQFHLFGITKRR